MVEAVCEVFCSVVSFSLGFCWFECSFLGWVMGLMGLDVASSSVALKRSAGHVTSSTRKGRGDGWARDEGKPLDCGLSGWVVAGAYDSRGERGFAVLCSGNDSWDPWGLGLT